ncbi:hypothetical protein HK101_006983, partial [Irineochytrium annulatum]
MLVRPTSTEDILAIRDELAKRERGKDVKGGMDDAWEKELTTTGGGNVGSKGGREREVEAYGNLAFAAVTGNPLIILGTSKKIYIHLSKVSHILSETDLGSPCQFSIHTTGKQEYRFTCDTSPEYQQWITHLRDCYEE